MPLHTLAVTLVFVVALVGVGGLITAWLLGVAPGSKGRIFAAVALADLGVGVGFLGSIFQAYEVRVGRSSTSAIGAGDALGGQAAPLASGSGSGGIGLPVGALIGLALFTALLILGATLLRSPIGVLLPAAGWLVVLAVLMYGSGKGDVVLANTGTAQLFLYGGLLLAAGIGIGTQQIQLRDQLRQRSVGR